MKPVIVLGEGVNKYDWVISHPTGEYAVYFRSNPYLFEARRYGAPWRDLTGDHLVHALCNMILETKT